MIYQMPTIVGPVAIVVALLTGCVDNAPSQTGSDQPAAGGQVFDDLGGRPNPNIDPDPTCQNRGSLVDNVRCPDGSVFAGVEACDDVDGEESTDCFEVSVKFNCDQTSTAACISIGEPQQSSEVCDGFDNDRDGQIDEDADCPERVETCATGDEDRDGRFDEGLECDAVAIAEATYPCDSGNRDHEYQRQWDLCPSSYTYSAETCDVLASSEIADGCITITNQICGEEVTTTCQRNVYLIDNDKALIAMDVYPDFGEAPIDCTERNDLASSANEVCARAGLESSESCWASSAPSIPPTFKQECVQISYCTGGEGQRAFCALPSE